MNINSNFEIIFATIFIILNLTESLQPSIDKDPDYAASVYHLKQLVLLELAILPTIISAYERKGSLTPSIYAKLDSYLQDFVGSNIKADFARYPPGSSNSLKQILSRLKHGRIHLENFADETVKHPLKAFRTIRQFTHFLNELSKVPVKVATEGERKLASALQFHKSRRKIKFPNKSDRELAMLNILRLRQIYWFTVEDLMRGKLEDFKTGSGLTLQQIFEIANYASDTKMAKNAEDLYNGLIKRCEKNKISEKVQCSVLSIHLHLRKSSIKNDAILSGEQQLSEDEKVELIFEKLCKGGSVLKNQTNQNCFYLSSTHFYYLLGPLKVELHSKDPFVLQVYDVLSSKEMQELQEEVQNEMRQSGATSSTETEEDIGRISEYRTSSNAWIQDEEDDKFSFLNLKVNLITGLKTKGFTSSEYVQIAAYNPGAYYTPHLDAIFHEDMLKNMPEWEIERGDRLMTFMIYLSDVEKGGGTAFPLLGTLVEPAKGSAVLWYNLDSQGNINPKTIHGGCPVLYGTKWIANKWIRASDQMFLRKCPVNKSSWNI